MVNLIISHEKFSAPYFGSIRSPDHYLSVGTSWKVESLNLSDLDENSNKLRYVAEEFESTTQLVQHETIQI